MDTKGLNSTLSDLLCSDNGCEYTDLSENTINKVSVSQDGICNVMHLNIRSLPKNIDNLTLLLSELEAKGVVVHVIAVCETFVTKFNSSLMTYCALIMAVNTQIYRRIPLIKSRCHKMGFVM